MSAPFKKLNACIFKIPHSQLCLLAEFMNKMLANGKGAAFFVSPHAGTLGPLETQTVNITAYTEMWGKYRDNLLCKV